MKKGAERTGLRRLAAACLSAAVLTAALWSALAAPALAVTVPKKEKAGEETFADAFRRGEIENNGGHFVRVGDRVYFRQYGKGTLDSPHVNGKFLNAGTGEGSSKITYYDASEQSVRAAFEDDGAGELYATPDGFWLERAADGPYYTDAYLVTPEGEETIGFFENRIPQAIREDIVQYLTEHKMQMRNEVSVLSDYYRSTSGEYEVRCRVREKQVELIDLTLSVPGEDQARAICQNWKETSQEVYAYLMKILLADHRSKEP